MAGKNKVNWKFPKSSFVVLRIEILFLIMIAVILFLYIHYGIGGWLMPIIMTIGFLVIYFILSWIIQKIRKAEKYYNLTPKQLEVTHKTFRKSRTEKVQLKHIKHHKLDKTFLGGYMLTHHGKKHLLFFNDKKEVNAFEHHLKKHLPKKK